MVKLLPGKINRLEFRRVRCTLDFLRCLRRRLEFRKVRCTVDFLRCPRLRLDFRKDRFPMSFHRSRRIGCLMDSHTRILIRCLVGRLRVTRVMCLLRHVTSLRSNLRIVLCRAVVIQRQTTCLRASGRWDRLLVICWKNCVMRGQVGEVKSRAGIMLKGRRDPGSTKSLLS